VPSNAFTSSKAGSGDNDNDFGTGTGTALTGFLLQKPPRMRLRPLHDSELFEPEPELELDLDLDL
jgi:hypothetical protein